MSEPQDIQSSEAPLKIPFFGARKVAQGMALQLIEVRKQLAQVSRDLVDSQVQLAHANQELRRLGALSILEIEERVTAARATAAATYEKLGQEHTEAKDALQSLLRRQDEVQNTIVTTEEVALLQEAGIYQYHHPLSDAVGYRSELDMIEASIKDMVKKEGGAVLASTTWHVNNSLAQGRVMIRDFSKLMLRAFNAEADNLVRGLKPYKIQAAVERLEKVAQTIERLGKTMDIRIAPPYVQLRVRELRLTADFLQKQAEEKETERAEREKLREERKVQQELERERARLMKERQHFANALNALVAGGNEDAAGRIREQLADVDRALTEVDYREANIRAGYVYVISNIGSFGESMVKVGMTRRLDPLDRIRELSDASVPFNFDVHALFFSKDAVGIETAMHSRLQSQRVNLVNRRREFFRATAAEAKDHLSQLAGELLEFQDIADALEYRQSQQRSTAQPPALL
jgi:hypothetical protein